MSELVISDLRATVDGKDILKGVTLTVRSGEVHAVMGPNGSGKSTLSNVLMGKPGYVVTGGSVTLDGVDMRILRVTAKVPPQQICLKYWKIKLIYKIILN